MKEEPEASISPCPKCGTKLATGSLFVQYFDAESEPYEAGKEEALESNDSNEICDIDVHLTGQYCEKCEAFAFLCISEAPMIEVNLTKGG